MIDLVINGRFLSQATTGVQRVSREVTREIDQLLHEGAYPIRARLVCQNDAQTDGLKYRAITVERVGRSRGHWWEQVQLPRTVGSATLLCLGNTAPVASLLGRGRVAVVIHDLSYRVYPSAYSLAYRLAHGAMLPLLLRHANPLITVSDAERREIAKLAYRLHDRIVVAPNGPWPGGVAKPPIPALGARDGGYLLYVGSLSQRKNFSAALAVATRLAQEEGLRSIFVGAMPPYLTSTHVNLPAGAAGRITFAGQVENLDQLAAYYRGARCLLLPSFYESGCLPPAEAMQFGCPVVVSDIPSQRERCGQAAEYCDPADLDDIIAAVRRVIGNPSRAAELVELGFAQAGRFSWRAQARTILAALVT